MKSLTEMMPRESHIESQLPLLMKQYIPLLENESEERIKAFLMWRTFLTPEIRRLMMGERFVNQDEVMSFLRLMRGSGCPLPAHLMECSSLAATERSEDKCKDGALYVIGRNIETANAGFFRILASLMERAPENVEDDYPAYVRSIAKHLIEGQPIYKASDTAPRGKNYLQKLLLAITDVFIGAERRLPRIEDLRDGLAVLMEKPPGKREVIAALAAIGLAGAGNQVLEP